MRHPYRFRPTVSDALEERVVPSQGGPSLSAIRDRYIAEFRSAFRDLRTGFQNLVGGAGAVRTIRRFALTPEAAADIQIVETIAVKK